MPEHNAENVALNTDRELYRESKGDLPSDYYANSVHVTAEGHIGMNVGGTVYTLPIAEWHRLAAAHLSSIEELIERSSFGTPEAKALRYSVSNEQVARVLARAKELDQESRDDSQDGCHPRCSLGPRADHPGYLGYRCITEGVDTLPWPGEDGYEESLTAPEPPCCPGAGTMAHVRGCINHPEADRG